MGGALDQDDLLMADIDTYAWLFNLANKQLDKEDEEARLVEQQLKGMRQ